MNPIKAPVLGASALQARFAALSTLLKDCAPLWRPEPRQNLWPHWLQTLSGIQNALEALGAEQILAIDSDLTAQVQLLEPFIPQAAQIPDLCAVPRWPSNPGLEAPAERALRGVPGRKRDQIEAFAQSSWADTAPRLLDWCAGKGHLARTLAVSAGRPVLCVEREARLCRLGRGMAIEARAQVQFQTYDVFEPDVEGLLAPDVFAVALHACGGLHRRLLKLVGSSGAAGLALAPCCYHLFEPDTYQPLSLAGASVDMPLTRAQVRLCLQESVVGAARDVRARLRGLAWRLGAEALMSELLDHSLPVGKVPGKRLRLPFGDFVQTILAERDLVLPQSADWDRWETLGWQRAEHVQRLELVRHLFRRPLELWLVLDRALFLQEQGLETHLGIFCTRSTTPRNLLLQARR